MTRAFQRIFTCKIWRRYSRERAPSFIQYYSILFNRVLNLVPGGAVVAVGYGAELRRLLPELEGLKADGLEESRAPRKGIFDSREDVIIDLFDKLLSLTMF